MLNFEKKMHYVKMFLMLEIVIGNRLRDISRAVISKIDVSSALSVENFIVVPDRFSLIAEKMVFEELGIISTFNIRVVGVSKLARLILEENDMDLKVLSQDECKLIVLKILKENNLKSFKEKSFMLAEELLKIISQLKSNNIDSKEFFKSIENKNNDKLKDIARIFLLYEKELEKKYDQNDLLSKLIKSINVKQKHNYFFVEFDSFTEQIRLILEKLVMNANRVVVGAVLPEGQKNAYSYDNDILVKVNKICRINNFKCNKSYISNNITLEQNHILRNIYGFKSDQIDNENVFLFNFSTPEEETKNIAKIINFEVYTNKKRFSDFNILIPKIENHSLLENVFSEYKIPYFIDIGTLAEQTETIRFITLVCNYLKNQNIENFLSLLKNFYSQVSLDKSSDIENYLNSEGIFGLDIIINNQLTDESIIVFCKKLIEMKLVFEKVVDCKDYINLVEKIIKVFDIENQTECLIQKFANEKELKLEKIYKQIFNRITESLEVLKKFSSITLEFDEFIHIFIKILNSKEIYSVPTALDCVFIGDSTKSFFEERDILFVCQASQKELPTILKDSSMLSDKEIEELSQLDINPTVRLINKRNKFKLIQNLTMAKEKIITSYSSTALGEKEEPSSLIFEIQKIFSKNGEKVGIYSSVFDLNAMSRLFNKNSFLEIQSKKDYNNVVIDLIVNYKLNAKMFKEIFKKKEVDIFDTDFIEFLTKARDEDLIIDLLSGFNNYRNKETISNPKELFFKNNKISATHIEQFYQCPFRYFFTHGLKVVENEVCEFDGRDVGTFFHEIADVFIKKFINTNNLSVSNEISTKIFDFDKDFNILFREVYKNERLLRLKNNPKNKHMIVKLENEAKMFIRQMILEQKWSDFKIWSSEKLFNYNLEDDFKVTGRIDRVDVCGNDFRVIDYKSGEVKQSLAGVYYGIEIQLFLYLLAMKKELELRPVAGLYFPVGSDFVDNKTLKKLILTGFILADSPVIKKLDKRFNSQYLKSDIISLNLSTKSTDNDLKIDGRRTKNIFSEKGFNSTIKYVERLIKKTLEKILTGNILATPLKFKNGLPCRNCEYYSICSFLEEENNPREEAREMTEKDFINIERIQNDDKV